MSHIIAELREHDRYFRLHARIHPEKLHVDIYGAELGEGVYPLYAQNMWPEIYGPEVWQVSSTYWRDFWPDAFLAENRSAQLRLDTS